MYNHRQKEHTASTMSPTVKLSSINALYTFSFFFLYIDCDSCGKRILQSQMVGQKLSICLPNQGVTNKNQGPTTEFQGNYNTV